MEIFCPNCDQTISYIGEPPKFCQNCGKSIAEQTGAQTLVDSIEQIIPQTPTPLVSIDPTKFSESEATIAPTSKVVVPKQPMGQGEIVGPYRLERWLGSGGMGNVWEAVEVKTGRRVALKRLSKSMVTDESYLKRFVREARLAAKISHPRVTFVYNTGTDKGQPYIAMELMPGKTLADKVESEGPLDIRTAVDRTLDMVDGLIAAHRQGMVHRDVKPGNCFLDTDDTVKIGDFGLSKSLISNDVNLTQTGTFMGTPSYAAPEQIRGGELDGRTDGYAVGATLYFLLTARTPFKGDAMSVTAQIMTDTAPSTRKFNPKIPKELDNVISKCLQKDPVKRFQDLEDLKVALLPYATQPDTITDAGRRLAAFMIDQCFIQIVALSSLVSFAIANAIYLVTIVRMEQEEFQANIQANTSNSTMWFGVTIWCVTILYYGFFEGRYGRAVGKRIMGFHVVDVEGQRVGFWRSALRTFAVPGCFGIPLIHFAVIGIGGADIAQTASQVTLFLRGLLVYFVPLAICASTMRASNRLLGLQGIISGTRVVRLNTGKQKIRVPVVEPKLNTIDIKQFGPYATRDLMGESKAGKVYLGSDESLNRDVWVVERENGSEPGQKRINLARVSRQRWLEGGTEPSTDNTGTEVRWDAFEAIHGVPIQTFVGLNQDADWSHYGQVMKEMVAELRAALADGTLPQNLSLTQVWLDEDGHAKLLDKQLVDVVSSNSRSKRTTKCSSVDLAMSAVEDHEASDVDQAVHLIQDLGDLIRRTKLLPASVQDFLVELSTKPVQASTLDWAGEQLDSLSTDKGNLTWDSRLGIVAATVGLEMIPYVLVAIVAYLFCFYILPIPNYWKLPVGAFLSSILPVVFGFWFRGGPVFKFMGVQVCNSRGRPASGLVCGIRSWISWSPAMTAMGFFFLLMLFSEYQSHQKQMKPEIGTLAYELMNNDALVAGSFLVSMLIGFVIVIGLAFAIYSPRRGLVDYVVGTRLMPK
ncbi:MAG: protein kinase [Mariniblastus sp.]